MEFELKEGPKGLQAVDVKPARPDPRTTRARRRLSPTPPDAASVCPQLLSTGFAVGAALPSDCDPCRTPVVCWGACPSHDLAARRGGRCRRGSGSCGRTVAVDLVGFGIVVPLLPLYARRLGRRPGPSGSCWRPISAAQFVSAPLLGRLVGPRGPQARPDRALAGTAARQPAHRARRRRCGSCSWRASSTAPRAGAWPWPRRRPPTWWDRDRAPRVRAPRAPPTASGFVVGPAIGGLAALGGRAPAVLRCRRHRRHQRRWPRCAACPRRMAPVGPATTLRRSEPRRSPRGRGRAASRTSPVRGAPARRGPSPSPPSSRCSVVAAFSAFEATFALFGHRRFGFDLAATGAVFAMVGVVAAVTRGRSCALW